MKNNVAFRIFYVRAHFFGLELFNL